MTKQWKKLCAAALSAVLGVTGFLYNPACTAVQAEPAVTEIPGTKHTEKKIDSSFFSVTGFAEGKVKDRSQYKEGDPEYAVVTNDVEFLEALMGAKNNLIEVIELRNNIYLGWNELSAEAKEAYGGSLIAAYKDSTLEKGAPVSNPSMVESGVSQVTISNTDSLTIFSENGNNIEHAEFKVEGVNDLIIRNINFYNVWDWDDQRTSGYGTKGDMGTTKRTGWSYVKLNHAKNVWFDHCNFGVSYDGCVDIENGSRGISITWCNIGDMDYSKGSMIYKTATLMDYFYQKNKEDSSVGVFKMYQIMRDNGMTNEDIMKYMGHHKKCHLGGGGETDSWYFDARDEKFTGIIDRTRDNANEYLRMTYAYNNWHNIGSRVPLLRGGVGHLFNCYMDDTELKDARELMRFKTQADGKTIADKIGAIGGSVHFLFRGMNARNGASVAADTNVYYNVDEPLIGAEHDRNEYANANNDDGTPNEALRAFSKVVGYNNSLIVNSRITNTNGKTYEGSSWDNNGENWFMGVDPDKGQKSSYWRDKSTINNWKWRDETNAISGESVTELAYEYQTFPLDDVKENLAKYGGAYTLDMSAKDWLRVKYDADEEIKVVDKNAEVPITGITLSKSEAVMFIEEEFLQLDARVVPAHTTESSNDFKWTSSNPEVAEVIGECGLVIPKKTGKTTITVTTKKGLKASCDVIIQNLPTKVEITDIPEEIYEGDVFTLKADVQPGDLSDETAVWTNSDTRTKVLDKDAGTFQALKEGQGKIKATANLLGNRTSNQGIENQKSKIATLTIKKSAVRATGVEVPKELAVKPGEKVALGASVIPENTTNKKLLYAVSDSAVATVDQEGNVTGVAKGETVVTVTSVNGGFTAECKVKVAEGQIDPPISQPPVTQPPASQPPASQPPVSQPPASPLPSGSEGPSGDVMTGDVNGDKKVTLTDAQMALKSALNLMALDEKQTKAADIDGNGKVELKDAQRILKVALNLDTFDKKAKTAQIKSSLKDRLGI